MENTHRIALQNGRELNISAERLLAFENNQVESDEVYSTLDSELYHSVKSQNRSFTGGELKGYTKTINQFFLNTTKYRTHMISAKRTLLLENYTTQSLLQFHERIAGEECQIN